MKKLSIAVALAGGLALSYTVYADRNLPLENSTLPGTTMQQTPGSPAGAQGRPASSMFNSLDTNRDGYIDSNEAASSTTLRSHREIIDFDRDGRISQIEFDTFDKNRTSDAMRQTPSAQSGAQGRPASSMFNSLDNNRDGYLDSNEGSTSTSLRNNRQVMDLDRDGRISQSEWETFTSRGLSIDR
ncbi:MAG: hypothetical protein V5B33_18745 [Candidatus Accumulibacter sp. UW20]|jgi:Ca2+-binding EF-hand superfamily protein